MAHGQELMEPQGCLRQPQSMGDPHLVSSTAQSNSQPLKVQGTVRDSGYLARWNIAWKVGIKAHAEGLIGWMAVYMPYFLEVGGRKRPNPKKW